MPVSQYLFGRGLSGSDAYLGVFEVLSVSDRSNNGRDQGNHVAYGNDTNHTDLKYHSSRGEVPDARTEVVRVKTRGKSSRIA